MPCSPNTVTDHAGDNRDVVLRTTNLSKAYRIYERSQDRLLQSVWGRRKQLYRGFRALDGISLDVYRGETLGIIGLNGSGKSTLLQLVAGTLTPTEGEVQVNGRISALLELGAGFNAEFTGSENIHLAASIAGLTACEIKQRQDRIAEYAAIGDFIDQPVKTYSSGMYVRLAFAIAISIEPEVLIIDEALAVGDMEFQAKCVVTLKQLQKRGTTILFVSHVRVIHAEMVGDDGLPAHSVKFGQQMTIRIIVEAVRACTFSVNYKICDKNRTPVIGADFLMQCQKLLTLAPQQRAEITYRTSLPLADGKYSLRVSLTHPINAHQQALFFDIVEIVHVFEVLPNATAKFWTQVYLPNTLDIKVL